MKKILALLASIAPALIVAAGENTPAGSAARSIDGILNWLIGLAARALPLLILAALVLFLFGIVRRFFWAKEGTDKGEAGKFILWGIVALFVMVSVWGLVNVLKGTFNLDTNNIPAAPAIPYQRSYEAQPGTSQ